MTSRFPQIAQAGLIEIVRRIKKIQAAEEYDLRTKDEVEQRLDDIAAEIEALEQEARDLDNLLSVMDNDEIEDAGEALAALTDERRRIESYLRSVSGSAAEAEA